MSETGDLRRGNGRRGASLAALERAPSLPVWPQCRRRIIRTKRYAPGAVKGLNFVEGLYQHGVHEAVMLVDTDGSLAYLLGANTTIPAGNTLTSTSETAFASTVVIPANSVAVGDYIKWQVSGTYGGTVVPSYRSKFKIGSTTALDTQDFSSLVTGSNLGWRGEVRGTITAIGASGTIEVEGMMFFATSATASLAIFLAGASVSIDWTQEQACTLTSDWGAGGTGQTITLRSFSGVKFGTSKRSVANSTGTFVEDPGGT
jgi:hypothetical protein